jgi:membrane-associated phospholipid phosphatase
VSPLGAALLVALPPTAITYLLARRWPHRDPGAPKLTPETITTTVRKHPRFRALVRSRLDPTVDTGLLLTAALAGVVISLSAVGLLIRMVQSNSGLASFDSAFAKWGSQHADATSTQGLKLLSVLGGYQFLLIASVAVAGWEIHRGKAKSVVALLVLVVGGQFAVANAVKAIVGRARPDLSRLTGFSGSSFPSGHAAAAVASFSAFSLLLGRARSPKVKAAFAAITMAISVTVAASRVLLGVHWFTDVLGGMAIGWLWFTLLSIAFGGRILRFGLPVARAEVAEGAAVSTAAEAGPAVEKGKTGAGCPAANEKTMVSESAAPTVVPNKAGQGA